MKINQADNCRDVAETGKTTIAEAEAKELQKMISDRWNEIWYIVQTRKADDPPSNSNNEK